MSSNEEKAQRAAEVCEKLFFHVLMRGGKGNPFQSISHDWFVSIAAPKLLELLPDILREFGTEAASYDEWRSTRQGPWTAESLAREAWEAATKKK